MDMLRAFLKGVREGFIGFFMTPVWLYRIAKRALQKTGKE